MSNCKYCGKPVGFLKSEHKECKAKHEAGFDNMVALATDTAYSGNELKTLEKKLSGIAEECFLPNEKVKESLLQGFSNAVNKALEDSVLTEEEEKALNDYKDKFSFSQEELDSYDEAYTKIGKGVAIRQVMAGTIPNVFELTEETPVILQKDEVVVWAFYDVNFLEIRTRTHYEGRTQGISVKVVKGLYYRTGAFRGNPIQTTSLVLLDKGTLIVTNKSLYFSGPFKKFRIKYQDVLEFTPYDDGIGVTKNTASAKPQVYQIADGWFVYNLVINLARI